jgi:hypothetical protein
MDGAERAFVRVCELLDALVGPLTTILIIVLIVGMVCLCAVLTILVLWKYFSLGVRFAMLKAWVKVIDYLTKYFNRLRRYGLTKAASRIAVVCAVVMWTTILFGFAFTEELPVALLSAVIVLFALFCWGWWKRGPSATFFKFSRGFLEPTLALALPTFVAKSGDFIFKLVVATIRTVL